MNILEKFTSFYANLASMKISELDTLYDNNITLVDPIAEHNGLNAIEGYFTRLLENAQYCEFIIHQQYSFNQTEHTVIWTMQYTPQTTAWFKVPKTIQVDGISLLKTSNDKISYQRDYYDLGQMVYENIPILGWVVKKIKRSMV